MPLFGRKKDKKYEKAARLLADGNIDEAAVLLREIISKQPNHENAIISLGVALSQVHDSIKKDDPLIIEAFELFDRAQELNPENPVPIFNKAVVLRNLGMLQDALAAFDQVLEIEERNPLAILHKAEINYELENYEDAIDLARLALTRDPGLEGSMGWVRVAMRKAGLLQDEGNVPQKSEDGSG